MISFTQAFYGMDELFYMKLMNLRQYIYEIDEIVNGITHTDFNKEILIIKIYN